MSSHLGRVRLRGPRSLRGLALINGCAYVLSLFAMVAIGQRLAILRTFLPFLLLTVVAIPLATVLLGGASALESDFGLSAASGFGRLACVIAALAIVFWARVSVLWLLLGVWWGIFSWKHWTRRRVVTVVAGLGVTLLGAATVWNLNYVIGAVTSHRLMDPTLIAVDLRVLSAIGWPAPHYEGLFPLVSMGWSFRLLENSYSMLFCELLVTILFLAGRSSGELVRYLSLLFSCYAVGLAVFAVFPTVGPFTYQPTAFQPAFRGTMTFSLMTAISNDYHSLIQGGPIRGFGYFIALPSLHVAAATLTQRALRPSTWLYWLFLPINLLLVASTVLLGYHYILDLPAGWILGATFGRHLSGP
jgi:membrane-associated phospholipid phosphatase